MAGLELCGPRHLYNLLNQHRRGPRLAERGFLCVLDARSQREYDESHIITARRIEQSATGEYRVPDSEELSCVRYCVVYDCKTSSLDCSDCEQVDKVLSLSWQVAVGLISVDAEERTTIQHARNFEQFTRHPVLVLKGGYKLFSARYHFLRSQKIMWMPKELDNFQPYPVEILSAKLYLGNFKQACDQHVQKDLKIKAQVNISEQSATLFAEGGKQLHIAVPDSLEANLLSSFATICHFIDAQLNHGAVLVFSSLGISRSSTVIMAYLIHSCQFSLKRAWDYVLKCKMNMRPHRGFVKQLSDWETQIYGAPITDVSEPNY
ncbi:STYL1 protein, partial [Rhinopomastus cyanomelas]|nr:STYL1 protein [Rhinopomastus cyanomelas]